MADWDSVRDVLERVYMVENKSLKQVKNDMAKNHGFHASIAEYEACFRTWNWRKNLKGDEWKYVARKFDQRRAAGRTESAVFLSGIMVLPEKVRKELSRQTHPNDKYKLCAVPQSPVDIDVRTPPSDSFTSAGSSSTCITTRKRRLDEPARLELSSSKRRNTSAAQTSLEIVSIPSSITRCPKWQNKFFETGKVDLEGLPYYQFREIMQLEDTIKGFDRILTLDDDLCPNLIGNFWSEPSLPPPRSQILPAAPDSTDLYLDSGDEFEIMMPHPNMRMDQAQLYKPLGIDLVYTTSIHRSLDAPQGDTLEYFNNAEIELPALLANMPPSSDKDLQTRIELLLGPPTIEAARYFVEVGLYLTSNNILDHYEMNPFISRMLRIIPWPTFRSILSAQVPTIQVFAEEVLRVATRAGYLEIVRDLLESSALKAVVQSSKQLLVDAVLTSNTALVNLLLKAGANSRKAPKALMEARNVEIAQLLIGAGASINEMGLWHNYYNFPKTYATAIFMAVARRDVDVARYLISAGADVNIGGRGEYGGESAAIALAVESSETELLQLLLQEGADVNTVSVNLKPFKNRDSGTYPLQVAAALGNLEFAKLLIQHGADINAPAYGPFGKTALQAATSKGNIKMVKFLLDNGAEVNAPGNNVDHHFLKTVLTTAVEMNHSEMVEMLLDAGANVNMTSFGDYGCTALESAKSQPTSSNLVALLLAAGALDTALANHPHRKHQLREAVWKGDLRMVKHLLEIGVQINMEIVVHINMEISGCEVFEPRTILHDALHDHTNVNIELFRFLVDRVGNVRAQDSDPDCIPIMIEAVGTQNLDILAILINAGADINVANFGTPLQSAVVLRDYKVVVFLLSKGADVNTVYVSFGPATALQAALHDRQYRKAMVTLDIIRLLIEKGAIVNAPISPSYGRSELAFAVETGEIELVRDLLNLGAKVNGPTAENAGRTALQAAAELVPANIEMFKLLLEWGGDINAPAATSRGVTALQAAALNGNFQIALLCLKAGANVNALCTYEVGFDRSKERFNTALELAAGYGRLDMVHLLLNAGADLHLPPDERYIDAATLAREKGHVFIAQKLERWMETSDLQLATRNISSRSESTERVMDFD